MRYPAAALTLFAVPLCVLSLNAETPKKPAAPTFAKDVAPILYRSCANCHRPGAVAPFSLADYQSAKDHAAMVAVATKSGQMPPWKPEAGYGDFHGENRLTAIEIDTIQRWAEAGAPRGDKKLEPKAPPPAATWALGKPDMLLEMPKTFSLPAEGEDIYRNFPIKTSSTEPMWVSAIDVKPGNKKVVHHVIAFLDDKGVSHNLESDQKDGQPGYVTFGSPGFEPDGALGGWAPGLQPSLAPKGVAIKVEPGATVVIQVHYHLSGKAEQDQTSIGLYFSKEPVNEPMQLRFLANTRINIPAGVKQHVEKTTLKFGKGQWVYNVLPHMHLLGKSFKAELEFPDGKRQPLVKINDWDFNWQMSYWLKEPLWVPEGSKLHWECVFDNSADNPRNPNNPPRDVAWGEKTTDEMMFLAMGVTAKKP
jgi:hypothetical protein